MAGEKDRSSLLGGIIFKVFLFEIFKLKTEQIACVGIPVGHSALGCWE